MLKIHRISVIIIALSVAINVLFWDYESMSMKMKSTLTCTEALNLFVNKEFEQWSGLPYECQTTDIFSVFPPVVEDVAVGKLGSEYIPTSYKVCVVENYDEPVEVWFKNNGIVKIEAKYPQLSANQSQAITKALGKPTDKLDYYFDILMIPNGEWVYAERGISLFFNADGTGLVSLSVFYPSSLDNYKKTIRPPFESIREFPMRELEN